MTVDPNYTKSRDDLDAAKDAARVGLGKLEQAIAQAVLRALDEATNMHGNVVPTYRRGAEFVAREVRQALAGLGLGE